MNKSKITPKSDITKLLGAKPVLPGENAEEYATGLAARSADYPGRYQQSKRQSVSATIEEINRPRGLAFARG